MTCTCCNTPLSGGTDTFGDVGLEMCQSCFLELCDEKRMARAAEIDRVKYDIQAWDSEVDALTHALWQTSSSDDEQFFRAEIGAAYTRIGEGQAKLKELQS